MTSIIDYGVGNLFSLSSSIQALGSDCVVTADPTAIRKSDRIILPGVGAFGDAMDRLRATGLIPLLHEQAAAGKPLLGICLGMQLLFERSYEFGLYEGLSLIPGEVVSLEKTFKQKAISLKIPQMGWNALQICRKDCPLFLGVANNDYVYYVHSYYAATDKRYIVATSAYGIDVTGAVQKDTIWGTQFHPEKSGKIGLTILNNFLVL